MVCVCAYVRAYMCVDGVLNSLRRRLACVLHWSHSVLIWRIILLVLILTFKMSLVRCDAASAALCCQIAILHERRFENPQTANLVKILTDAATIREVLADIKGKRLDGSQDTMEETQVEGAGAREVLGGMGCISSFNWM